MKNLPMCDYDSPYRAADKALKRAASGSDNELLEKVAKTVDPKARAKREEKAIMIRKVVEACLDEYRDGEYSFKEAVKELQDALSHL